jgi:hypothetical protein
MSFPKQLELDALKQRIKETAANLAEMRKQLPAAIAAAKEEGGKPKKTLTPEHLAAMKAGREKKKAEKATSADEASAPEASDAEEKPKKEKKAKKVKPSADASEVPAEADADAEVKKVKKAKKAKASDSDADADAEPKVKKAPAAGTLAWHAYVKHMVETRPEAFVDMKQPQKFTVAKGMRAADPSGYEAFVADWKAL